MLRALVLGCTAIYLSDGPITAMESGDLVSTLNMWDSDETTAAELVQEALPLVEQGIQVLGPAAVEAIASIQPDMTPAEVARLFRFYQLAVMASGFYSMLAFNSLQILGSALELSGGIQLMLMTPMLQRLRPPGSPDHA